MMQYSEDFVLVSAGQARPVKSASPKKKPFHFKLAGAGDVAGW